VGNGAGEQLAEACLLAGWVSACSHMFLSRWIHGNRVRFMAEERAKRLRSVNELSRYGDGTYGFHGMHGKLELGGRGCVSPLPQINGMRSNEEIRN